MISVTTFFYFRIKVFLHVNGILFGISYLFFSDIFSLLVNRICVYFSFFPFLRLDFLVDKFDSQID